MAYRFQVPDAWHWRDVRAVTSNVGQALQRLKTTAEAAFAAE